MNTRAYKLRVRRELRLRRKQMGVVGAQTDRKLDRHFYSRLGNLSDVKRFVAIWLALVVLLISFTLVRTWSLANYYQTLQPVAGGTYSEGMLGGFTTANPVYATSPADRSVSELVFSGLFRYDDNGELQGDLATNLAADARGQVYTVTLRDDVRWHDGQPFTAEDVLFTYRVIQNADAGSPLFASWQGVSITSPDDTTVVFSLTSPLASFKYSLTNGILPEHVLADTPMVALRTSPFNTVKPVGTGPFRWQSLTVTGGDPVDRRESISLDNYSDYHLGATKLSTFMIKTYRDVEQLRGAYERREITAIAGHGAEPGSVSGDPTQFDFSLAAQVMTFFRTSEGVLASREVRQALVRSVNVPEVVNSLDEPVKIIDAPLLSRHIGYDETVTQLPFDVVAAQKILEDAGWRAETSGGIREKDGEKLSFDLYGEDTRDNKIVASKLQASWRTIGVQANVFLQETVDFQTTVSSHGYDALLHGIAVGMDPDVYAYWHSSQADARLASRLNFSEYSSSVADEALDSGRTRIDPALRAVKYKPFLQAWRDDAPALALYQPRFEYLSREPVYNLEGHEITTAADRFSTVHEWMIRRVKTTVE